MHDHRLDMLIDLTTRPRAVPLRSKTLQELKGELS